MPVSSQSGDANLIAVIVAATIGGLVMLAINSSLLTGFKASRHVALIEDINAIRRLVTQSLDCERTLATGYQLGTIVASPVNASAGLDCDPSSPSRKLLGLKDSQGNLLTASLQTASGPFQNTGQSGSWRLLAQCDRLNHTLVIRAARSGNSSAGFGSDPLTRRTYDFTPENSLYLFGGSNNAPKLCQAQLGGSGANPIQLYEQVFNAPRVSYLPGGTWPMSSNHYISCTKTDAAYFCAQRAMIFVSMTCIDVGANVVAGINHINGTWTEDDHYVVGGPNRGVQTLRCAWATPDPFQDVTE